MSPLTPKLTTLMLNHNPLKGISESFFVHMKALTFLDLSFTDVVRLPESISELENLRALLLCHCNRLVYVPSVAKLTKLRVLELTDNMKIAAPKGLERLKFLEKLPHFIWKMSDVTGFNAIIELWQFALLGHYQFRLYDDAYADQFPHLLNYYEKYQIVVDIIGGQFGEEEPSPLLPCTTEVVDIFCMNLKGKRTLTDVLPSLAVLNELNVLIVGDCAGLEYITISATKQQDSSIYSQLESLEKLELSWLPDLRGIIEFGGYSFSRLKEFRLKSCPKIKVVFSQYMEFHLPNLRLIDVTDCNELEEIFESDSSTSSRSGETVSNQDISGPNFCRFNPIICLPKLEAISLEDLPMLRSISGGLLVCASLGYVRTVQCAKLKLVSVSRPRINDTSASTLASFALSNCLENISGLVPALFVIGDSSVDCGNNNFLGTFARADHLPYGRDFDTHQPTGRFSNGRIPVDFLGTNDYIHYYLLNVSGVQSSFTPWNFNHLLATSVKQGIMNLHTEDARKVVVMGLAPMGCAPHYLWRHKSKNGECIQDINNMIREFNFMMRYTVEQLNKELLDAKIIFCDTYEGSMKILENHESYGFRVTTEACCGLGSYKGWIMCLSPDMACSNASSHVWWDQYHPTDAINGVLAENVWSGLNDNICYPMNMKDMIS
ncbi:hypothetical protein KSS87_020293 [Heliosperma pusillum]|nr:hypothetical protein KSS87_020293 [Heliosperma pusillum]